MCIEHLLTALGGSVTSMAAIVAAARIRIDLLRRASRQNMASGRPGATQAALDETSGPGGKTSRKTRRANGGTPWLY
jgi:hypothetical protein